MHSLLFSLLPSLAPPANLSVCVHPTLVLFQSRSEHRPHLFYPQPFLSCSVNQHSSPVNSAFPSSDSVPPFPFFFFFNYFRCIGTIRLQIKMVGKGVSKRSPPTPVFQPSSATERQPIYRFLLYLFCSKQIQTDRLSLNMSHLSMFLLPLSSFRTLSYA